MSERWTDDDREAALLGLDLGTRRLVRSWAERDAAQVREIPWTPLAKPLRECTIALASSSAIARRDDRPFDQDGERRNPWWGDPSFRVIPRETATADVRVWHLHVDPSLAESDLDCALPLTRLRELEAAGEIGASAPSLPFEWPEPLESVRNELPEPTPIGQLVRKRPWLYLRFLKGDIPD